ncbi:MAG TPA: WecB/TagA/CpsF family glycosyltransferase [Acidimicrobiales bacterium]|nr:WecB/TagA/CpsF family glycosyltransferase [Acidimicrobiales bacterium]
MPVESVARLRSVDLLGVPVAAATAAEALAAIRRLGENGTPASVFYANAHSLTLAADDRRYGEVLRGASLVLNDGSGVAIAARAQGVRFPENLNGTDFTPRLLAMAAEEGWKVFFLGGRPGVAERAAARLADAIPGLRIAGTHHGYLPDGGDAHMAARIAATGADVVVVAMGNPKQEEWIAAHGPATGARLAVAVGAFLDFAAGEVPRAPAWMNRWGVEWLFRLRCEPRRLWRRYLVGNPVFLSRVAADWARRRRSGTARPAPAWSTGSTATEANGSSLERSA